MVGEFPVSAFVRNFNRPGRLGNSSVVSWEYLLAERRYSIGVPRAGNASRIALPIAKKLERESSQWRKKGTDQFRVQGRLHAL